MKRSPISIAQSSRDHPPRFSSVLTILITMVSRMVRIWVEKNRKASRMKLRGAETVELKAVVQDGIKKEIVAFANGNGGTVYAGVDNDDNVLGVEDADGCALQVFNMMRDTVRPDVTMFVSYETLDCDGKAVVAVK